MRCLVIILLGISLNSSAQVYNRMLTFRAGYTFAQWDQKNTIDEYNDTSSHQFEMVWQMPSFTYSHEFMIGDVISVSGTAGWQYMNVFYDHKAFGTQLFFLSVNPKILIFKRERFEYYMKLKAGVSFWKHDVDLLDDATRRLFPERTELLVGITIGGFNFFLNDHWGLNTEISVLSPEFVSLGITYRFWRGKLPRIQGEGSKNENEGAE